MRPYKQMHARMEVYTVLFMGGFEVQNFRGNDGASTLVSSLVEGSLA